MSAADGLVLRRLVADRAFTVGVWVVGTAGFLLPVLLLGHVVLQGLPVLSWEFLTAPPRGSPLGTEGGVGPAVTGTLALVAIGLAVALPLGVGGAVHLAEFGRGRPWTRAVRVAVEWLAGVPALVYGLFGYAALVVGLGLGISLAAGGITLGLAMFPIVLVGSEEALRAADRAEREAALALGVSRFHAARRVVLRRAWPGILSSVVVAAGHAAGSAAPVLYTASVAWSPGGTRLADPVMTLPTHLYNLVSEATSERHAYGTAAVLVLGLLLANSVAALARRLGRA